MFVVILGVISVAGIRVSAVECGLDAKTINAIIKEVMGQKMDSVTKDPDLRKDIGRTYIEFVTPYVPMKTGKLRSQASASGDGRVMWTATKRGHNYAETQYTTQYLHYTTPGTGPYWTDHLNPGTELWDDFKDAITPMIIRRFKGG